MMRDWEREQKRADIAEALDRADRIERETIERCAARDEMFNLVIDCLSEIKATYDGESTQPVKVIIEHFLLKSPAIWDRIRAMGDKP